MEMSMQSSSRLTSENLEPQKKLSIKDRLGPIRGASSEDRPSTSSLHKSKKQSNDDFHDSELGKNHWKETNSNRSAKDERLNISKKSPSRKGKWLVQNRLKYTSIIEKHCHISLSEKWD